MIEDKRGCDLDGVYSVVTKPPFNYGWHENVVNRGKAYYINVTGVSKLEFTSASLTSLQLSNKKAVTLCQCRRGDVGIFSNAKNKCFMT